MEIYHSQLDHRRSLRGEDTPWIREYGDPESLVFFEYPALDLDRYCIGTDVDVKTYRDHGYLWERGMLIGNRLVSRTFVAPRDGFISVRGVESLSYLTFAANRSSVRLMHNGKTVWPREGEGEDGYMAVFYDRPITMPTMLLEVKEGDRLRFIGRNTARDLYDDLFWVVEIAYKTVSFREATLRMEPGDEHALSLYVEGDASPALSSSSPGVATVENGCVLAKGEGIAILRATRGGEILSECVVEVAEKGRSADNPYGLSVLRYQPFHSVGAAISVETDDTFQLASALSLLSCSHGCIPTSARRFDHAGEVITLPREGEADATLDFTLSPDYTGGRTIRDITLYAHAEKENGQLIHIELWYSRTDAPEEFHFLYAYRSAVILGIDTHVSLRLSGFGDSVQDLATLRLCIRRVDGQSTVLEEVDVNLDGESEEILALRRAHAERIWLPSLFADGMLFQHGQPIRVWGFGGREGESVTVLLAHADGVLDTATATVTDGKWLAVLPPHAPEARGACLTVGYRDQSFRYTDILIGELFLAGGQSNMAAAIVSLPRDEIARFAAMTAGTHTVRYYYQTQAAAESPRLDTKGGRWLSPAPQNMGSLSAVAVSFAFRMAEKLRIPIGILTGSKGATALESWLPEEFFGDDDYGRRFRELFREHQESGDPSSRPIAPFYQMIAPLTDMNIGGVIWYQGEHNSRDVRDYPYYADRLWDLLLYYRRLFRNERLAIGTVGLAPYRVTADGAYGWCRIREELLNLYLDHPNEAPMAVITDTADETHDIHPPNKDIVGRRLADAVGGVIYGCEGTCMGPIPTAMRVEGNAVRISFSHIGSGLVASDGDALRGFEVSGNGADFYPATVEIAGDALLISSASVDVPYEVRYAFDPCPRVNFANREGYPATPFRMTEQGLVRNRDRARK